MYYNADYIEDAQVIPVLELKKGSTPADIMRNMEAVKRGTYASDIINENKSTANGAIIGMVAGFLTALWFKQNKIIFSIGGSLTGAFVGKVFSSIKNTKNAKLIDNGKK